MFLNRLCFGLIMISKLTGTASFPLAWWSQNNEITTSTADRNIFLKYRGVSSPFVVTLWLRPTDSYTLWKSKKVIVFHNTSAGEKRIQASVRRKSAWIMHVEQKLHATCSAKKKAAGKMCGFFAHAYYDSWVNTNEFNCEYCVCILLFAILRASTVVCFFLLRVYCYRYDKLKYVRW